MARRRHRDRAAAAGGQAGTKGPPARGQARHKNANAPDDDGGTDSQRSGEASALTVPTFSLDTSCIVAAVCTWHEHHDAAVKEIGRRLEDGESLAVPAPALIEAYAVLTRLPAP